MVDTDVDMSGDPASQEADFSISDALEESKQSRRFREILFWGFGGVSMAMLIGLFCELTRLLTASSLMEIAAAGDWHFSVFLLGILLLYASVPLSIVISLMKMTNSSKSQKDDSPLFTSPQIELLKAIASLISTGKGG